MRVLSPRYAMTFVVTGSMSAGFVVAACADDSHVVPTAQDAAAEDASPPDSAPLPRGERLLGLDIGPAEDGNYIAALARAKDAGVQTTNVTLRWPDLETPGDAGTDGGTSYFNPYLHIANLVFPSYEVMVSLAILPVDTVGPRMPSDLAGRALDDPEVIDRFDRAQDYVWGEIPDLSLVMYVLGNEIDVPFGSDPAKYGGFGRFFQAAAGYARKKRPSVKVGFVVRLAGAIAHADLVRPLLAGADFLGITYYPVGQDFAVESTDVVRGDIAKVAELFPSIPIYVREGGCPSGALVGSSLDVQADFVRQLYRAWDENAARVPLVTFFTMHDYAPKQVEDFAAYYGVSDPKFKDYLGTLGLRSYAGAGTDKPSWGVFVAGAHGRGW